FMETKPITLTTDFGYKDPFVGIMKGVILGINPNARIVDLSHGIAPHDIRGAALALKHSAPFFPPGTIHVAVVDPGVGTQRRAILIESEGGFFIGPDNGVLSFAVRDKAAANIVELTNESYHLKPKSATFHGRDVFAPVAAHLSVGVAVHNLGSKLENYTRLDWPEAMKTDDGIQGEIIYIDNFGNLITNVSDRDLKSFRREKLAVSLADVTIHGLASNYAGAEKKDYTALINSWGLLEISCFNGRAHLRSGADIGDPVHIRAA
ncbi:MAG: SAM hydrolase/SAM-dependent halogenase family protein, partial [Candidatus Binatia bacterium]